MSREHAQQVAALEAERQRSTRDEGWSVAELLGDLIAALARLYTTPPDREVTHG